MSILEDKIGKEVVLINDNAAVAVAEKSMGAGRCHDNLVYVGIGTGIGGGALKNAEKVISPLSSYLREYAFNKPPEVVASPLGEAAPPFGAITIALNPNLIRCGP